MQKRADLLINNAHALTMDEKNPTVQAIAIKENKILAMGSNTEMSELLDSSTQVIDAMGATVMPGFIESHMHLFAGAVDMESLNLFAISGKDNVREAVNNFTNDLSSDELLFAVQADYKIFSNASNATRHDLDELMPNRPFAMMSSDYHTVWANTKALKMAGIFNGGKVAEGCEIVMDVDGRAQGELREFDAFKTIVAMKKTQGREALGFLANGAPTSGVTREQMDIDKTVLVRGLHHCAKAGITSIHNMDGNFYQLELLDELQNSGELNCRVQIPFYVDNLAQVSDIELAVQMRDKYNSDFLSSGRVKFFMDGVLESGTAFMLEAYSNNPQNYGSAIFSDAHFKNLAVEADKKGLQMSVHAIGDAAVRRTLDGYQTASTVNGKCDSRHRIEHIEIIHTDDISRLAELGVIASMQPLHAAGGGKFEPGLIIEVLGEKRLPYAYPAQTLRNCGTKMIFSSDWPVVQVEPVDSIKSAMTRKVINEQQPDQRQSLDDTLASYTRDGAYAEFAEHKKGMLKAGMLADIVVLSEDLHSVSAEHIDEVKPMVTICDGKISYDGRG